MLVVFAGSGPVVNLIGVAGIIIALIVLVVPSYGWSGLKTYVGSLTRWKVGLRWYLIALIVPLAVEMAGLAIFLSHSNIMLPLNPAYWNLSYAFGMVQKVLYVAVLAVIFAGFITFQVGKNRSVLRKSVVFCLSLLVSIALIILAALLSYGNNFWLFIGIIPAAFIATWLYERAGKSLLMAAIFLVSFLAFELASPANWLLTGGFPEAMALGAVLYFLIAILIIAADRRLFFSPPATRESEKADRQAHSKSMIGLPVAMLAIAVIVAIISATFIMSVNASMSYPQPTGQYKAGKIAYDWVDPDRPEITTGNTTSRELMVYIWYPAEICADMAEAPVMDAETAGAVRPGDAYSLGFLKEFSDHTYKNAPVSADRSQYPVLVMSHGDSSSPLLMAVTAADLASHGYIVAGISYTYNSQGTVFPDGRIVKREYNYSLIGDDYINFSLSYYENAKQWARHNAEVELREADDVSFVLDRMEQLNLSDPVFKGKIDMSRIGTFGHSLGGAVSITSAERDGRIKAAADLDGALYHSTNITKPTMLLERGSRMGYNRSYDAVNQRLLTPGQFEEMKAIWDDSEMLVFTSPPTAYYVGINGTEHNNFKDYGPLGIPLDIGSIDGRYATRIIDAYLLAFFDKSLNGIDSPLLGGEHAYPEVVFKGHVDGMPVAY
jgi:dienelactone hydrolase/membrane protease YdiL (CAAX protease family)